MKFGLFYQLPCATTQDAATRYQETIEQIVYAEELGFDATDRLVRPRSRTAALTTVG